MFNASTVALINIFLLYKMDMKINGLLISGIYIMFGFAFMGKNLLNIIPFYLGAYAYTQFEKRSFKTVIASCMFTTALSPVVSSISKAFNFSFFGIILAILAGFLMGFIVPAVSAHVINFHNGYTLYNTGLGAGLIAIIIYAILEEVGLEVTPNKTFVEKMDYSILALLILVFSFYIIYGYYANGHSFKNFGSLLMHSGRLVTDFTVTEGFPYGHDKYGNFRIYCPCTYFSNVSLYQRTYFIWTSYSYRVFRLWKTSEKCSPNNSRCFSFLYNIWKKYFTYIFCYNSIFFHMSCTN